MSVIVELLLQLISDSNFHNSQRLNSIKSKKTYGYCDYAMSFLPEKQNNKPLMSQKTERNKIKLSLNS